jgi:hypothetical protein
MLTRSHPQVSTRWLEPGHGWFRVTGLQLTASVNWIGLEDMWASFSLLHSLGGTEVGHGESQVDWGRYREEWISDSL